MPKSYTSRGFANYAEFKDSHGADVVIRDSSADPLDKVWVFVKGGGQAHWGNGMDSRLLWKTRSNDPVALRWQEAEAVGGLEPVRQDGSILLDVEQAEELIAGLQEWVRGQKT